MKNILLGMVLFLMMGILLGPLVMLTTILIIVLSSAIFLGFIIESENNKKVDDMSDRDILIEKILNKY